MYDLSRELKVILIDIWLFQKLEKYWQKVNKQHRIGCGEIESLEAK
jgi:hypothetical protein